MDNVENNKSIAKFLNLKPEPNSSFNYYQNPLRKDGAFESMRFHCDWNWLMSVISKINEIDRFAKDDFKTNLLHYQRNNHTIFDKSILDNIDVVYSKVIEFIKWYNQQYK